VSKDKARNLAASVRHRLTDLARKQGEDFQFVLTRYVIERLLYRLSRSQYRDAFVLKGAMLFRVWTEQVHRPTRDLDLLSRGEPSSETLTKTFRDICGLAVEDDGLIFDPAMVTAERIKEDQEYEGIRIACQARLGQARIALQIDVAFGDTVVPGPANVTYPAMLDFASPVLRAYPQETVVAEKFQAMVMLGIANSRMKDFFDLWTLANALEFDGASLSRAIRATCAAAGTDGRVWNGCPQGEAVGGVHPKGQAWCSGCHSGAGLCIPQRLLDAADGRARCRKKVPESLATDWSLARRVGSNVGAT
jgi:predicted nucleotidyltransferase component of viral defense system